MEYGNLNNDVCIDSIVEKPQESTDISLDKLIEYGALNEKIKDALVKCVGARLSILVSGGTGSGKSTFLNALSSFINPNLSINTGHDGSMSTGHANSPQEAMKRVISMVASARELTAELVPSYVAGGIDIVVQLSRMADGSRKVVAIHEVMGEENGEIITNPLVEYKIHSYDGKVVNGDWEIVNEEFSRVNKLREKGIKWDGWL